VAKRELESAPARTLVIASGKGGATKSTAAVSLAAAFALGHATQKTTNTPSRKPLRTLTICLDGQANAAQWLLQNDGDPYAAGVADILTKTATIIDTVQGSSIEGLDVLPPGPIDEVSEWMVGQRASELLIRDRIIRPLQEANAYDIIVIDTPPAIGQILVGALVASDGVALAIRASDPNSPAGARDVLLLLEELSALGTGTPIGYLLGDVPPRPSATQKAVSEYAQRLGVPSLGEWPRSEAFPNGAAQGIPVPVGWPNSKATTAIQNSATLIWNTLKKKGKKQ
jgi:cellulose biosynthesis protein BcsQ